MFYASFRFYAGLNHFLPRARQQQRFIHDLEGCTQIKDIIESIGVPHTEVDLILVNSEPVDFDYTVEMGDYISVYPVFETLDISSVTRVRPRQLSYFTFVLDIHLGRLARYLRVLGFDALYPEENGDEALAQISDDQDRILLTRDVGLLKRKQVTYGYYVRSTDPQYQVSEVLRRFNLFEQIRPFLRCVRCNGTLQPVEKVAVRSRVQADTYAIYDEFRMCDSCEQIYWRGSHYQRMQGFISSLMNHSRSQS